MKKLRVERDRTMADLRKIAIGAAAYELRKVNGELSKFSAKDAYEMLDLINRMDFRSLAARWYRKASENQYKLFCREWNTYVK
jgi:hypothetical protein